MYAHPCLPPGVLVCKNLLNPTQFPIYPTYKLTHCLLFYSPRVICVDLFKHELCLYHEHSMYTGCLHKIHINFEQIKNK